MRTTKKQGKEEWVHSDIKMSEQASYRLLRRGDPAGARTPDNRLKRQVLYLLSYRVIYIEAGCHAPQEDGRSVAFPPTRAGLQAAERPCARPRSGPSAITSSCSALPGRDGWNRTSDAGVKVPCLNRLATPLCKAAGPKPMLRPCSLLGWAKGLEPSTLGTTIRCSTN